MEIMAADAETRVVGQDVDALEDNYLLEIHEAVGENLLNGFRSKLPPKRAQNVTTLPTRNSF